MKQLDSIRVRPINSSADERLSTQKYSTNLIGGISDVKITISQVEPSDIGSSQLNLAPGSDIIVEWLPISDSRNFVRKVYTQEEVSKIKSENNDGFKTFSDVIFEKMIEQQSELYRQTKGIKNKEGVYAIVQKPYQNEPPQLRSFGSDPYYLNNGAKIDIIWMIGDKFTSPQTPEFKKNLYESFGFDLSKPFLGLNSGPEIIQSTTFSQIIGSESDKIPKGTWLGGLYWSTPSGEEFDPSISSGAFAKGSSSSSYYLYSGVWKNPDNGKLERYPIEKINKYIIISSPKVGENGTKKEEIFSVKDVNIADFGYIKPATSATRENSLNFYNFYVSPGGTPSGVTPSGVTPSGLSSSTSTQDNTLKRLAEIPKVNKDTDIIGAIIETWKRKVPNYGKLALSKPSYFPTLEVEYISPINPGTGSTNDSGDNKSDPSSVKFPLVVQLPTPLEIKSKKDMPSFKVYVNKIPEIDPDNIFTDEIEQFLQDDDEYVENNYTGDGEQIHTIDDDILIDQYLKEVASGSLGNDSGTNTNTNTNTNTGGGGGGGATVPQGGGTVPNLPADSAGGKTGDFAKGFNGVPYYMQGDERWGENVYTSLTNDGKPNGTGKYSSNGYCTESSGKNSTIRTSGCGVTSLCMVINFWAKKGYTNGKFTDPKQLSIIFAKNGGRVCGSGSVVSPAVAKAIEAEFGLKWKDLGGSGIATALKKGYPCLIGGQEYRGFNHLAAAISKTTKGHFMCATGIDSSGRMRVNDPGYAPSGAIAGFSGTTVVGGGVTPRNSGTLYPKSQSAPA